LHPDRSSVVPHREIQRRASTGRGRLRDADLDVAGVRKLDGVAQEIQEDLPQPQRVAAKQVRALRVDIDDQVQAFLGRLECDRIDRLVDDAAKIEFDVLELGMVQISVKSVAKDSTPASSLRV
jgi:hypothetical protein